MKKLFKFRKCSLLFIFVFFSSCNFSPSHKKGVLRTAFTSDPRTIDPRKNGEVFSSFIQKMVFEGLTRLEEGGKVELALAEKIDVSADGLTYLFHLRDAQWSDQTPITAYDFEYTWKQVLTPGFGAPCAFLFYPILNAAEVLKKEKPVEELGVRALNAKTLEVRLCHPTPYSLSLISFCPFFAIPKHIDEKRNDWHHISSINLLVSSGPYRITKWTPNSKIVLQKNTSYWDQKKVSLEGIEVFILPDEKTVLRMFEAKELDLLNSITTPLLTDDLVELRKEDNFKISPISATFFCTFNLKNELLQNPHIRKALALSIDREAIVKNITQMQEEPASRYIPSTVKASAFFGSLAEYNPLLAKQLFLQGIDELKKQGVPVETVLKHFSFSYENTGQLRRIAQAIQQSWKEILGLDVTLQENDFKTHAANLEARHYGIALHYWVVHYLDPMSILDRFKYSSSLKNYPGYENPAYTALLDAAQATKHLETRSQIMQQAEQIMAEDLPLSPLFHSTQVILKNDQFENVLATPLGDVLFKTIKPRTK